MKRTTLFFAITYSLISLWWTYRFSTNLPKIAEQAQWITVGDILALIGFWVIAIYYWFMFERSRNQSKNKNEK